MRKFNLIAITLAFIIAAAALPAMAQGRAETPNSWTLITPADGAVLKAGSQVLVTWDLQLEREITENEWAEMEYVLETDEGVNMRLTPQMTVDKRSFMWTVPNVNTNTARLVLQVGIEGEGERFRFVQSGTFTIKFGRGEPYVLLNSLRSSIKPGHNLDISWTSNLRDGSSFDVMVSFDRGAHFHKAATTSDRHYTYTVDPEYAGAITVQIVGTRPDGRKVSSLLTRDASVRVVDKTVY